MGCVGILCTARQTGWALGSGIRTSLCQIVMRHLGLASGCQVESGRIMYPSSCLWVYSSGKQLCFVCCGMPSESHQSEAQPVQLLGNCYWLRRSRGRWSKGYMPTILLLTAHFWAKRVSTLTIGVAGGGGYQLEFPWGTHVLKISGLAPGFDFPLFLWPWQQFCNRPRYLPLHSKKKDQVKMLWFWQISE